MSADPVLPPTWQVWVAGNLIRGRPADELVRALVDEGYAEDVARGEVDGLAASPGVVAARIALRPVIQVRLRRRWPDAGKRVAQRRRSIDSGAALSLRPITHINPSGQPQRRGPPRRPHAGECRSGT